MQRGWRVTAAVDGCSGCKGGDAWQWKVQPYTQYSGGAHIGCVHASAACAMLPCLSVKKAGTMSIVSCNAPKLLLVYGSHAGVPNTMPHAAVRQPAVLHHPAFVRQLCNG